jgi:hypothetical protein
VPEMAGNLMSVKDDGCDLDDGTGDVVGILGTTLGCLSKFLRIAVVEGSRAHNSSAKPTILFQVKDIPCMHPNHPQYSTLVLATLSLPSSNVLSPCAS